MTFLLIGQSSLAISAMKVINVFWFACISRFCVGLGGKNISVARTTYSSDWFIGKELSFALALSVGVSRLGAITVLALSPVLFESTKSLSYAFWFGDVFVLLSTICGLIAILIDQYVIKQSGYKRAKHKPKEIKLRDLRELGLGYWLITTSVATWYMSFNCFVNISNKFAVDRFGLSIVHAGYLAV